MDNDSDDDGSNNGDVITMFMWRYQEWHDGIRERERFCICMQTSERWCIVMIGAVNREDIFLLSFSFI